MSNLKIEYVKLSDLQQYEKNARTHSEEQVQQLMHSITEFGFTNPVLIDENNVLIAGHGRSMAAERLGMDKVPAIRLVGLSDEKRKALRIADNQLALNAGWDMDLLAQEIQDLQLADYDVNILGFSDEMLNNLLDNGFDDVSETDPTLKAGDRDPIRNITFTVSADQLELIERVISETWKLEPDDPASINENRNGNSLYYICRFFENNCKELESWGKH